jgi:hypothetical protein
MPGMVIVSLLCFLLRCFLAGVEASLCCAFAVFAAQLLVAADGVIVLASYSK